MTKIQRIAILKIRIARKKIGKVKIAVTGDSVLNGANGKGLSKSHNAKVKHYPGATSEDILDKIDDLLKVKPDCLLVHVGTNDLTNNVNLLNSVKTNGQKSEEFFSIY